MKTILESILDVSTELEVIKTSRVNKIYIDTRQKVNLVKNP
jgi:hypothetical protein